MILANYLEQHESIRKQIAVIDHLIEDHDLEGHANQIALEISRLAGIIRIHLSTEDQYLYPTLLESEDEKLSHMAKDYMDEMGGLFAAFTTFKDSYNTKGKIMAGASDFEKSYHKVIDLLDRRIKKEESNLYQLIK